MSQLRQSCSIILFLSVFVFSLQAQIDTEFWFAAPSVTEGHGDRPIVLRFTAFQEDAHITISQPANPTFASLELDLMANETRTVDLTFQIDRIENEPAFTVLRKGLHIESDQPITAYYEVNNFTNPDIFALKGRNALGTEFYIPAQNYWSNIDQLYVPQPTSTIDIVATSDNTEITITPSVAVRGHSAGVPFQITLNRGETYSVEARDVATASQLTGTHVVSNQLIAITLKDDSNQYSQCHDLGGDQLVPIDVLGQEYIVVKGFLNGGDQVFVMAVEDGTDIMVNGRMQRTGLNPGEIYRFGLSNPSAYIKSNHPVYVLHGTGFGCEVGLALLPKLECTGSQTVSVTRSSDEFFGLILITETGNEDDFTISPRGSIPAEIFDTVPGTDGRYMAAQVDLTNPPIGNFAMQISNSSGIFHLGTINGGSITGTRYGYFSDFKTLKVLTEASQICLGAEVLLTAVGSDDYKWFGHPDVEGITSNEIIVNPDTTTEYGVIGSSGSNACLDTAYLTVDVFKWPQPEVDMELPCIGSPIAITYVGEEVLEHIDWYVEDDTIRTGWRDTLHLLWDRPRDIDITLSAINPAGCFVDTTLHLEIGGVVLGLDTIESVERGFSTHFSPEILEGKASTASIQWSPPDGLSCADCLDPVIAPQFTTNYQITVADTLGCTTIYEALVYVDEPVYVPNAFSPNGDQLNEELMIYSQRLQIDNLLIFDRWGNQVFSTGAFEATHRGTPVWDGRTGSQNAPPGVYIYYFSGFHMESGNPVERKGSFHLIK